MLLFPKPKRKPKLRKPLKRSRKAIKARAKFKAHGDNPFKNYRRRFTDYQLMVRAEISRQARLRDPTAAELAFADMLDGMRILYEREKIFLNGDRFILADFYFKPQKLVIELDGSAHDGQKEYDAGRDAWLLRGYGVKTVRFTNAMVFKKSGEVRRQVISALSAC
jgi:very-short-patch-repair endonuclease